MPHDNATTHNPTAPPITPPPANSSPVRVNLDRRIQRARGLLKVDLGPSHVGALIHDHPKTGT